MGACLFHACVVSPEARRGHWVSLGLELQMIESCPVDVGPWRSLAVPGKGLFDHPQAEDCRPGACACCLPLFAHHEDALTTPLGVSGVMVARCAGVLKH